MKKCITILVLLSSIMQFGFAQSVHEKQVITIKKLKVKNNEYDREYHGLKLKFNVHFKYPVEEFFERDYDISCILINSQGDTVYADNKNTADADAGPSYSDPKSAIDYRIEMVIPYSHIELAKGTHSVKAVFSSYHYDSKVRYGNIYTKTITVTKPEAALHKYVDQQFEIKDWEVEKGATEFMLSDNVKGVMCEFNCYPKYAFDQIIDDGYIPSNKVYFIKMRLLDEQGNVIYTPDGSMGMPHYESIDVYYNYYDDYDKNPEENLEFFIPYYQINKEGSFNATVEFYIPHTADADFSQKPIYSFSKDISITIPKQYAPTEQYFEVEGIRLVNNHDQNGELGIAIKGYTTAKYNLHQIKGCETNTTLGKGYFNLTLSNKDNAIYSSSSFQYSNAAASKTRDDFHLFIPYTDLDLKQGQHALTASLEVTDYKQSMQLADEAAFTANIQQPKIYLAKISVSNMEVNHSSSYDVGVFPGKNNRGRGYPESYWKITKGSKIMYSSGIARNSFSPPSGTAYFKLLDQDELDLDVYDYDALNRDDFIGSYDLKNPRGVSEYSLSDLVFDDIKSANVEFSKFLPPNFLKKQLTVKQNVKNNGVSGISVFFDYNVDNLTNSTTLTFEPNAYNEEIVSGIDSKFTPIDETGLPPYTATGLQPSGNIALFLPYYRVNNNNKIAINVLMDNSYKAYETIVSKENITIPEINDITIKIEDVTMNKDSLVQFIVSADVPVGYLEPNRTHAFLNFGITHERDSNQIQKSTTFKNFNSKTEGSANSPISQSGNQIKASIPLSVFYKYAGQQTVPLTLSATANSGGGLQLGNAEKQVNVDISSIKTVTVLGFNAKAGKKIDKAAEYLLIIKQNGKEVYKSNTFKKEGKYLNWAIDNSPTFIYTDKDNFEFELCKISSSSYYSSLYPSKQISWSLSGKKLKENGGTIQLGKTKIIKSGGIEYDRN